MKNKKESHPIVNQVLTPEFLKQFKDSGELNSFMEDLYARAMGQMIEGEMDHRRRELEPYIGDTQVLFIRYVVDLQKRVQILEHRWETFKSSAKAEEA